MGNGADDFLAYLAKHAVQREMLKNAVLEEILEAGIEAGYQFSLGDLEKAIYPYIDPDSKTAVKGQWSQ